MDTTTSSIVEDANGTKSLAYTSCITIDGQPILPPVMTEERRMEMRNYRQQAIEREHLRRTSKIPQPQPQRTQRQLSRPSSATTTNSNSEFSPGKDQCLTSTPKQNQIHVPSAKAKPSYTFNPKPKYAVEKYQYDDHDEYVPVNLPVSTSTSSSSLPRFVDPDPDIGDGDGNDNDGGGGDSDDSTSGDNFASAASSTGTFIIKRDSHHKQNTENLNPTQGLGLGSGSEAEVEEIDEDSFKEQKEPQTVIRRPHASSSSSSKEPYFKRKRPARYFDMDEPNLRLSDTTSTSTSSDENDPSARTQPTYTTSSSTSLSKYLQSPSQAPQPQPFLPLPNAVPPSDEKQSSSSPSFTINTDFLQAAGAGASSKSEQEQEQRCIKKGVRRRSSEQNHSNNSKSLSFVSAASALTSEREHPEANPHPDSPTEESDKENAHTHNASKEKPKHVRKLSYTLLTPSVALLEATALAQSQFQALSVIPSTTASGSEQSTPMKNPQEDKENVNVDLSRRTSKTTPSSGELDARFDKVQTTLEKLQQLHLGKGKKAHLERYLGELKLSDENDGNGNGDQYQDDARNQTQVNNVINAGLNTPKSSRKSVLHAKPEKEVEQVLTRIEHEHQKQLESLMEIYKQQAHRMREQFEREKSEILAELRRTGAESTAAYSHSHSQSHSLLRSPVPVLADTSNLNRRDYYLNNSTPSKDPGPNISSTHSAFTLGVPESNSNNFDTLSTSSVGGGIPFNPKSPGGYSVQSQASHAGSELGSVGLSKLQDKMQKINPNLFKISGDLRSPLLKGLVFPDPLDRSSAVLKIPPEATDPANKYKFERLTAAVKGYLTRRLLHTEKIQIIIQTIRDTVELLLNLYEESPPTANGFQIKPQDEDLHKRVLQQLTGACGSFHDIFFKISVKERMAIIANDREKIRAKALKNVLSRRQPHSPTKRNISNATLKSIERRMTLSRSPGKKDIRPTARRTAKPVSAYSTYNQPQVPLQGSQSVKPKPVKSYNLGLGGQSPKRRRMSYWGGNGGANANPNVNDKLQLPSKTVIAGKSTVTGMQMHRATTVISVEGNVNARKGSTSSNISSRPQTTSDKTYSLSANSSARSNLSNISSTSTLQDNSRFSTGESWASDTFVIPSNSNGSRQNSWGSNVSAKSTSGNNNSRKSTRHSVSNRSGRASMANSNSARVSNVPWK